MYFAHVPCLPYLLHFSCRSCPSSCPSSIFPPSPFLFARAAPSSYQLKLECFWILIGSCTSFPHSFHSRTDSDTLEHFTQGCLYLQRETDRLTGSHANRVAQSVLTAWFVWLQSFLSSSFPHLFCVCAHVCLHDESSVSQSVCLCMAVVVPRGADVPFLFVWRSMPCRVSQSKDQ